MPADITKPNPEGEKNRPLDRGIREMMSALTGHLTDLHKVHKPGSSHPLRSEDELGFGVITLAGTNTGATMKGEVLGRPQKLNDHEDAPEDELQSLAETYVNSNYQAVNNSIMLGSTYRSNDPGVHLDIADVVDPLIVRPAKYGRRGNRKGKELAQPLANPDSEFTE